MSLSGSFHIWKLIAQPILYYHCHFTKQVCCKYTCLSGTFLRIYRLAVNGNSTSWQHDGVLAGKLQHSACTTLQATLIEDGYLQSQTCLVSRLVGWAIRKALSNKICSGCPKHFKLQPCAS